MYGTSPRMPSGKHAGRRIADVPSGYLAWVVENVEHLEYWLRQAIESELDGRHGGDDAGDDAEAMRTRCDATVKTWYRELTMKFHPDRGGSNDAMKAINCAHDRLRELLGIPA